MQRTPGLLADGREIIWYDQDGTDRTATADDRDLPPAVPASELRLDPLTGEWVAVASHRQSRTFMPAAADCPLCPSVDGRQSEIPSAEYDVVALENRFPSLSMHGEVGASVETGLEQLRPGVGRCEVVCFTSDHQSSFTQLTPAQARLVIDVWAERTAMLGALPGIEYVYPFENRGVEIGVTLQHPHGQIYAFPYVPPKALLELTRATEYQEAQGRSMFGDIIASEIRTASRVILDGAHWIAFVPFAARWPMEVHLYPKRQVADLSGLSNAERDDLATVYLEVLRRFDALYPTPMPCIAAWQQAPTNSFHDVAWLHLELFSVRRSADKIKYLAGTESGQGAFMSDVAPEQQAARLRAL